MSAPWRTIPLGDAITFQRGFDLPHHARQPGTTPVVSSAGITDCHATAMCSPPGVITGRYGTIGELFYLDEPYWPLNTTLFVKEFRENDPRFVFYLLQRFDFESFSGKSGVPGVNRNDLHLEKISIPSSINEQRAIAAALADVDAAVAGLERLIAKKRDLKQAVMQQLLTGQTRLPGFSGKWEVKRLGDNVTFLRNGTLSRAQLTNDDPVRYLHYGDIHGSGGVFLSPSTVSMPTVPGALASRLDRLQDGDLVFADASEDLEGVGKSVELQRTDGREVVSGLHTIAARFDKDVLADSFKAYLQFIPAFSSHLKKHAAGTKVLATNRSHIATAELELPTPDEQKAIAVVFNDMDVELSALEVQLDKTRLIKQAMMHELLTGRTRLPFQ